MKRTLHGMLVLIAVSLLSAPAAAQVDRATLSGVVKDTGGGVVPGATVVVINLATNLESRLVTTETGGYQAVNLIPGRYQVDVELSGFKKNSQVITLEVGQRARLDVELAIGSFAETVIVAESPQLINANDATLGAVIPQMQVSNLPLAIRNWDDLLALVPGVQGDRYTEQGGGTSFGRTGGINVHGARALQNNFLLDGVDNNSISENVQELSTQVSRPSVDAIQEFNAQENPAIARVYGVQSGITISSVVPGSPADRAGLKVGDTIVSVDGKPIKNGDELVSDIAARKPGAKVTLGYFRNGKKEEAAVTVADRAKLFASRLGEQEENGEEAAPKQSKLGVNIRPLTPEMADRLNVPAGQGVVVQDVKPGSFADDVGLTRGDVILEIRSPGGPFRVSPAATKSKKSYFSMSHFPSFGA